MQKPLKIKELSKYISTILKKDPILGNVYVEGEVSNFSKSSTGHIYFSLKDDSAMIRCIIFKNMEAAKKCNLKDGDKIHVKGSITTYEAGSYYQILVKEVEEVGLGDIYREYEILKKKFYDEGLFDNLHKKDIPIFSKNIGVVTSPTGAAINDIIDTIKRRFPVANIILFPAAVQGSEAPEQLFYGLDYLDKREDIDVIIIGRGGGSFEDLNAFNDEILVRRIFDAKTPIISAVGHEIDNMLTDFVADKRAATPTAAGEIATPDMVELLNKLNNIESILENKIKSAFKDEYIYLEYADKEINFYNPQDRIKNMIMDLDSKKESMDLYYKKNYSNQVLYLNTLEEKLKRYNPKDKIKYLDLELDNNFYKIKSLFKNKIKFEYKNLDLLKGKLKILNSNYILNKGYAKIVQENNNINSIKNIKIKKDISIYMHDGKVNAKAINKEIFDDK